MRVQLTLLILPITLVLSACNSIPDPNNFHGKTYNIVDYGATPDGKTLATASIQKAIDDCAAKGGGRVEIPSGKFLSGPISLASNIDLHLDSGAVLLFSRDFDQYPLVYAFHLGKDSVQCTSPITARGAQSVLITGPGTIDGQGDAWRPVKKSKVTDEFWNNLIKSGGVTNEKGDEWYPTQSARDGVATLEKLRESDEAPKMEDYKPLRDLLRPDMIAIIDCQNVLIDGPTFRNSPFWAIEILRCRNVAVRNSTIYNELWAQNTDGIGFDSTRGVLMESCTVYAGDDNIVLKSGKGPVARERHLPTEDVLIRRCTSMWGHGGFVIGSETSGDIRNVRITECRCNGTDIGLRFKSLRGRGGTVENVRVDRVRLTNIKTQAILFDMYYEMSNSPEQSYVAATSPSEPVSDRTPRFQRFAFSKIWCESAGQSILINGLPELPISQVCFDTVTMSSTEGAHIENARDIVFKRVRLTSQNAPAFSTASVSGLQISNLETTSAQPVSEPSAK
jgi:polygalacturonase